MRRLLMFLALSLCAFAQSDRTQQYFYNGTLLQYTCVAPASVAATSVSVDATTLTNIVVSSNTGTVTTANAHNLWVGARVTVTGSGTAALNGTYTVVTVPSSTTYTITTSGVSNGTYTTGITIATNSPKLDAPVWFVTVFTYDNNNNLTSAYPGGGPLSLNYRAKCSDRATY